MALVSATVCSVKQALSGALEAGSRVTVRGWVRTRRDSKAGLSFVNVSDGSCFDPIQAVVPATVANYESEVKHLTAGAGVIVTGTLVPSQGKGQSFEVQAEEVIVTGLVDDPETYPIQPKQHSMEFLREVAHLRPRTNLFGAVTRVRHTMMTAIHRHLTEQGFFWVNTPIITASDAEGAGDMFRLSTLDLANLPRLPDGKIDFRKDFFGREAFLTVSGQLNVEAYCLAMSKVYTFGPTFRAENSNTPRHLAEFWMVEPEIAFADLAADADCAEAFLKAIFKAVLDERADDMAFFAERVQPDAITKLEHFIAQPFERIDYTDAIEIHNTADQEFVFPVAWCVDVQNDLETYMA
jgi:asparaginyl-tRNA synthetase